MLVLAGPYANFIGCKTNFVFKSPQSGGICASQGSGDFLHELRFSGYDGLFLPREGGRAHLHHDLRRQGGVHDASKMWGRKSRKPTR